MPSTREQYPRPDTDAIEIALHAGYRAGVGAERRERPWWVLAAVLFGALLAAVIILGAMVLDLKRESARTVNWMISVYTILEERGLEPPEVPENADERSSRKEADR